ncbi:hypothetical protein F2Q68_00027106 [Brassica cretica]|uniref:Uncharacterized protein n=1 Tax=Brassica cretica TaxID=69181 RepID=A0A8S9IB85_BRACR|nr:hypothetical protein F2Q68_00027106 [Brassica cretica]
MSESRTKATRRRAEPSRGSARRRAQPSCRTARRRAEPTKLNHRAGHLFGELNRRVVVLVGEFGRHASRLARRARPDPGLSDSRIFRIAVISDLRDLILLVSF